MPKGTRRLTPWGEEILGRVPRCERTYSVAKFVKERSPSSQRLKKGTKAPPWRNAFLLWKLSESFLENGSVPPTETSQTFSCYLGRCFALQPRSFEMHCTSAPSPDKLVRPMPSTAQSKKISCPSLLHACQSSSSSLICLSTHPWGTYTRCQNPTLFLVNIRV